MGSVIQRGRKFYVKWKDAHGRWQRRASTAKTKTEARRFAEDLERKAERARHGLEALPVDGGGETFGELLSWWLETYSSGTPSHRRNTSSVRRHLVPSSLAKIPAAALNSGQLEAFLQAKSSEIGPNTINHLRAFVSAAFTAAKRAGRFEGPNPAAGVRRRKVPRRTPDYLKAGEVGPVLSVLAPRWQPLFATAIYTGLRKGELLGLRKSDVDLRSRLLTVSRSYDRDTTKGGHADVIPIAAELVPYLERALAQSPSALVFPAPDGSMMAEQTALEHVLRRGLGRAGIVTGYKHVCRRKGCAHSEPAADSGLRRCPIDGRKLWPKPQVRPIRFQDLRHTTASLLMMSGANPAAVQRILRHSDPRITTEIYGHLAPEYLRAEVDRLKFGVRPAPDDSISMQAKIVANLGPRGPSVVQEGKTDPSCGAALPSKTPHLSRVTRARPEGVEPPTFGFEVRRSIQLSYGRERIRATKRA